MVDGVRPSAPDAYRSDMVQGIVVQDPIIDDNYAERERKQGLWARACATDVEVAEDDTNFGSRKGENSNRESYHEVGKSVYLQDGCHGGTSLGAPKKGCYAYRAGFSREAWRRNFTRSYKALV
jgi:hypothetical protein